MLRPSVTPDIGGTYVARITMLAQDGGAAATALLTFGTGNLPPVAQAVIRDVPDGTSPVTLDGADSYDVDGDSLSYMWSVETAPAGSAAAIIGTGPMAAVSLDLEGEYRVALRVQDAQGVTSEPDVLDLTFLPNSGSTDVYRLNYDSVQTADAAVADTFDLGERLTAPGDHTRIDGFVLDDGAGALADTLSVTLGGNLYTASDAGGLLAMVDALELDTDPLTNARMSPDAGRTDLTLIFGQTGGSATLTDVIGTLLTRADLEARGVDFYEGVGGRVVAPVASARFDQLGAALGETLSVEPYASTDVDGEVLVGALGVLVAPAGAAPQLSTDIDGLSSFTADTAGDYLLALNVDDGRFTDQDHLLVVAGGGNLRPVARIAPATTSAVGARLIVDGSQSYDIDGDLLSYDWSLLSAPEGASAVLEAERTGFVAFTPDVAGDYVVQLLVADADVAGVPATTLIRVAPPRPVAEAGRDRLVGDLGQLSLDGTLSVGSGGVQYAWSSLGLMGDGSSVALTGADTAMPDVSLSIREGRFRDVIRFAPVYHFKRADTGGYCQFDTRLPGDLAASASEPVQITLHSRGRQDGMQGDLLVWEIENKQEYTRDVTLIDSDGVEHGTWTVPGRVSVHVTSAEIGKKADMGAYVAGTLQAEDRAKTNPFNRNNPVCTGPGSGVVQLIVADGAGASVADTVFVGNTNLRPVVDGGARFELISGETVDLTASLYAYDANGDALSFGWSLIARPDGSAAALDAAVVPGDALTFAPDRVGTYLLQITATDGELIAEPAVIEVEVLNSPPTAAITGPAETFVGDTATLDGTTSSDIDGDVLSYAWTLLSRPDGSSAVLLDADQPLASLSPDRRGDYVVQLIVSDYEFDSDPVTFTVTAPNRAPVAALDGPADVDVGTEVTYSAAGSSDPDNDPLTFSYAITAQPAGSDPFLADLGDGEVGFVADQPGEYEIMATVDDGLLTDTASLTVTAASLNQPPVLGDLRDRYVVELGLELALDLTGSDPDDDPISFFATPLPLPQGIGLEATSGALRFRPEAGQLGSYSFTVGVSDGTLTDTAVLNIDVVDATAGDTGVFGRVLDAKTLQPLGDMPVRLRDAALMTTTDASGAFDFGSLSAGGDQVIIEPSANGGPGGYLGTLRTITVTENQNRDLDPDFLLVPLTDGCATVVAGQDTVISSVASGLSVTIAADSVQTSTGAAYTGDVCLGSLPDLFDQAGFDEDTRACRIYALDAPGAIFTQGMTITGPNLDNLPESTRLEMWRVSGLNGLFRRVADAGVDAGGATVSGTFNRIEQGALFTFLPQAPATRAGADAPTGMQMLTPFKGDNSTSYTLPGYTAFGEMQDVTLSYHSQAANPTVIVAGDVTIAGDASLPVTLDTRIEAGGLSILDTRSWTPRQGLDGSTPALVGEEVRLSQSMPVDGSGLDSGRYAYRFVSRAQYDCSTVGASHNAEFYVQNEATSPYGNGWSIDGLQKLVEGPDGKVSIIDDDGVTTFDPEPTLTEFVDDPFVFPSIGTTGVFGTDIDGDGDLDVVYGENGKGALTTVINYGNGDLRLEDTVAFVDPNAVPQTGSYPPNLSGTAIGELNNDGTVDVAFTTQNERSYGFLANDGFGGYSVGFESGNTGSRALDVTVADIDQDGFEDIIYVANSGFFIFRTDEVWISYGGPNGRSLQLYEGLFFNGDSTLQVHVTDIDGDGLDDVSYRTTQGMDFWYNNGNRNMSRVLSKTGNGGRALLGPFSRFADFDGDGDRDLIYSRNEDLQYVENTGNRSFGAPVTITRPPQATSIMAVNVADANGDGLIDLVATFGNEVFVYRSKGDGTFLPFESGLVDYGFGEIDLKDINGDGSLDLLSTQRFSTTVHFSKPSASGRFVSGDGEFSELTRLPDGTWERRMKDGTVITYDENGLQTAEIDPQGNAKTYAYGADGRLETITDQVGGVTSFVYDASGRVSQITYPDGRSTAFEYDDIGNLTQATEPTGSTVGFSYDENGRLVSSTNQNGNTTAYAYDDIGNMIGSQMPDGSQIANQVASSLGLVDGLGGPATNPLLYVKPEDRITTVTDRKGQVTTVEVNQFGYVVRSVDPLDRETRVTRDEQNLAVRIERPSDASPGGIRVDTLTYDLRGNVQSVTEAVGSSAERSMSFTYEPVFNKPVTKTDGDGFTMTYAYDAFGEVVQITDSLGNSEAMTYTPEGKLATRTDKNGNVTEMTYNEDLNIASMTYADGSITALTYDAAGNTTIVAEAQGTPIERQVRRTFDSLNRILTVEVTGADGVQIDGLREYSYLPAGNVASFTDATGLVTTMGYDGLERLVTFTDPAEGELQRFFNEAGEMVGHISSDGAVNAFDYDEVGRLRETTDAEGFVKSMSYDAQDNLLAFTDARGGTTTFGYDSRNRMVSRTDPSGNTMGWAYDARGNLVQLTREDASVETATYDGESRRVQVVTADNTLNYSFDPQGNLVEASDDDSRVSFAYDGRNRVVSATTDGTVGPQPQVTLSYSYDLLGRRIGLTDDLGGSTAYGYDVESRLTTLAAPWGDVYSFEYDGEGRRTSLTGTSGRSTSYAYTNSLLSALTHVQSGVALLDRTYGYASDGKLTSVVDALDPANSRFTSYDALNRLVQVTEGIPPIDGGTPVPVEDYAYDGEGNRLSTHLSGLYSTNAQNSLTEDANYTYTYDARGNRTSRVSKATGEVETYSYDSQNRLVGYQSASDTAQYAYDALYRRIAKTTNSLTEAYIYDADRLSAPETHDVVQTWSGGQVERRWLFGPKVDEPLAFEDYAGTTAPGSGSTFELLANRLGSIIAAVSIATGSVAQDYDYEGYGLRSQSAAFEQPYGFTGREHDAESGLIHFRARAYDPETGTFLQKDPIGFGGGNPNLYAYVQNDPVNLVDPTGLTATMSYRALTTMTAVTAAQAICTAATDCQEAQATGWGAIFSGVFSLVEAISKAMSEIPPLEGPEAEPGPNDDGSYTVNTPWGPMKTYSSTEVPSGPPTPPEPPEEPWWAKLLRQVEKILEAISGG
ncbi:PKD domain-containing protein [Thalassococcus sp. BH17M4-6]